MHTVLDGRGCEGGNLTPGQLQEICGNGLDEIWNRLNESEALNIVEGQGNEQQQQIQHEQGAHATYTVHFHHGQWSHMLVNWRFPCVCVLVAW